MDPRLPGDDTTDVQFATFIHPPRRGAEENMAGENNIISHGLW